MTDASPVRPLRLGIAALLFLIAALVAGCSSAESTTPNESFAIIANADIGTGPARVLVGVLDEDGARIGSPDHRIEVEVAPVDDPDEAQRVPGVFTWILEDVAGLYRAEFDFDQPGTWVMTVHPEEGDPLPPAHFTVLDQTFAPNIGEPAPVVATPTLRDLPIEKLTTDPEPDPSFYQLSLEEALASGRPIVLVFSTPAYCVTATCGPLLNNVKEAASAFPEVNFIHVEVYTGFTEPNFAPDPAHLAPAVESWNLQSEPWVFVIDEGGTVTARFEGVMAPDELISHLS